MAQNVCHLEVDAIRRILFHHGDTLEEIYMQTPMPLLKKITLNYQHAGGRLISQEIIGQLGSLLSSTSLLTVEIMVLLSSETID